MKSLFDHEKLDVYQLELEFLDWTSTLIDDITHSSRGHRSELIQQLDRASLFCYFSIQPRETQNATGGNGRNSLMTLADQRWSAPPVLMRRSRSISYHPNGSRSGKKPLHASRRYSRAW